MNIVLAVTGSISAYKAHDLSRLLIKAGHQVRLVLSKGAAEFVSSKSLAWPGVEQVYCAHDDFTQSTGKSILHIELARWGELLIIAPLSANSLSGLAHARADDLLTSMFLAWGQKKPIGLFLAMNSSMLEHPLVRENIQRLYQLPNVFLHRGDVGTLACGEHGEGKLPVPEAIFNISLALPKVRPSQSKTFLITAGATVSPLDPVRYLTNGSSGITGLTLAREVLSRGHKAVVLAGKTATEELNHLIPVPGYTLERVLTTQDMSEAVARHLPACDVYVSAAAIADFEFTTHSTDKIKKSMMTDQLPIRPAQDILAWVLERKQKHQIVIGFAAETDLTESMLKEKFDRKPVDLLIGTKVHSGLSQDANSSMGFGTQSAHYLIRDASGITLNKAMSKTDLSSLIVDAGTRQ